MLKLDNGVDVTIEESTDGLVIETAQVIPDSFLKELEDNRHASHNVREREFMHVAAIPVALVDRWLKEGYNVYEEPIRKTVAKLKHENLEYFLATAKDI